jgi:hypothetical protein
VPLNIDSSRALRRPSELASLVQAILGASPNDESTWVEWKNGLVPSDKAGQVAIAVNILGMANRSPDAAAQHAEGFAYVVIGAEPGDCGGVTEIDPADLDSGLQRYLGSEGPHWSPLYLTVQGKSVLVITIDPPRRGSRMFTLQKEFDKYRAGAVFIRRPGKTIQAEPGDIRMLEDRYLAADQPIALRVGPIGADDSVVIRPVGNLHGVLDAWEARIRRELIPPPPPPKQGSDSAGLEFSELFAQVSQNVNMVNSFLDDFWDRDQRTDAEFEEEVTEYLKMSRDYYEHLALARLSERNVSQLRLKLGNASDRYYADVRVKVVVPAPTYALELNELVSSLPRAPTRPKGRGARTGKLPYSFGAENLYMPALSSSPLNHSPSFDIEHDGNGTIVTYDFRGIRAEDRITLDPALLLISSMGMAADRNISWSVTTSSVDGVARGSFTARTGEPIDAADLVPELLAEAGD